MPKATANIATLSAFHNLSAGDLVDRLGTLKAEITDLETREKALRRAAPAIAGAVYDATITEVVRWTLDAKAVRSEMGDAWWNARCRQALVTTVAVKPRAVAIKIAA